MEADASEIFNILNDVLKYFSRVHVFMEVFKWSKMITIYIVI